MNKREFLGAALGCASLPVLAQPSQANQRGPTLLTVTGAIAAGNRGPLDPALDQLMKKQGVTFDRAHAFDFAALTSLPATSIRPTLEYDGKPHTLRGPLLAEVLRAAGAPMDKIGAVILRALDGYAVAVPAADIRQYRFIVATHLDHQPMALGGLGPLWAVYDADRISGIAARPLAQRFSVCPWGLYHIEAQAA